MSDQQPINREEFDALVREVRVNTQITAEIRDFLNSLSALNRIAKWCGHTAKFVAVMAAGIAALYHGIDFVLAHLHTGSQK